MKQQDVKSERAVSMLAKIGIGYRVGKLTVAEPTEGRKSGYMVWKCICDCGNAIELDTRTLQRGTVCDCGCQTKVTPRQKDITGQRYGKLVALYPIGKQEYGRTMWHCVCDCGNEIDAALHQLTCGYRKSCGCMSYKTPEGKTILKDFIGKRFGMLTVLDYAGKINGMHYWKCVCDCGGESIVGQTRLQTGKTKSCGCLQKTSIIDNMKLYNGTSITTLEAVRNKLRSNNTSGYTGVYQSRNGTRWSAQVTFKNKMYHLGTYETKEEAVRARHIGEEMHEQAIEEYYLEQYKQRKKRHEEVLRKK